MEYNFLSKISKPSDVTDIKDLNALCKEIRSFLIESLSKTGGHIASNLGVVELTIALCRFFDFEKDKIVWDVGHQSYVYKLLTGRMDRFHTLRQTGGLSGFPKTTESKYDFFNTGHSSTSVSAALGMAKARDIKGEDHRVIAVIGDGALTGGMAFEALNDAAHSGTNMTIILNDNEMSINKNVGGLALYLSRLRNSAPYLNATYKVKSMLNPFPRLKKTVTAIVDGIKRPIKRFVLPGGFFEQLGINYVGPVDGHDIEELTRALAKADTQKGPSIVHVITTKGKGYEYAENNPDAYHGVSPFDMETGEVETRKGQSYSECFGNYLVELAREDKSIYSIVAAMTSGTGLSNFASVFPNRITDVGIAEQHAVTLAAGMATQGLKPVVALYSTFAQRAYDQILHDVALQNLHVVFALDRAGLVGEDGETHQGIYDLSYLSHMPNMTILAPADFYDFRKMLNYALYECKGPVVIRYPKGKGKETLYEHKGLEPSKCEIAVDGDGPVLLAVGSMVSVALEVEELLRRKGLNCQVVNSRCVKPFDVETLMKIDIRNRKLAILEDNCIQGGFTDIVRNCLNKNGIYNDILTFAFPDKPIEHGSRTDIFEKYGLNSEAVVGKIIDSWGDEFERKN